MKGTAVPDAVPRFGIVFNCTNPRPFRQPWSQVYGEVLEQSAAAEDLGYDHVWLSEHHFLDNGYCPSLLTTAAAIAARTSRIKIGTWVLLLPLHHPLRVAEDAAVVDAISGGRLILGVGLGYRIEEFEAFGVARQDRPALIEEGVELLRLAWGAESFSYRGRHFDFEDVDVTPKPSGDGPPIWMAARGARPARRAARLRCPIALAAGGGRAEYDVWAEALREVGEDPDNCEVLLHTTMYAADDPDAARAELRPYLTEGAGGSDDLSVHYRRAADHPRDQGFFASQAGGAGLPGPFVGGPEACARHIAELRAGVPATDINMTLANGLPHERKLHYMERFAKEVLPLTRR